MNIDQIRVGQRITASCPEMTMTFTVRKLDKYPRLWAEGPRGNEFPLDLRLLDWMDLTQEVRTLPTKPGTVIRIHEFKDRPTHAYPVTGVRLNKTIDSVVEINNWEFYDAEGCIVFVSPDNPPLDWVKV